MGTRRCGAPKVLKTWCEVRTGRTPGPSDVAEERRRPCRARWDHDLSMDRTFEKLARSSANSAGAPSVKVTLQYYRYDNLRMPEGTPLSSHLQQIERRQDTCQPVVISTVYDQHRRAIQHFECHLDGRVPRAVPCFGEDQIA